jgi:hypothetical protein
VVFEPIIPGMSTSTGPDPLASIDRNLVILVLMAAANLALTVFLVRHLLAYAVKLAWWVGF